MKRILILCDMFPPAFAPRMGYLCKYMQRAGWKPYVVTEEIPESMFTFLAGLVPATYVRFFHHRNHPSANWNGSAYSWAICSSIIKTGKW